MAIQDQGQGAYHAISRGMTKRLAGKQKASKISGLMDSLGVPQEISSAVSRAPHHQQLMFLKTLLGSEAMGMDQPQQQQQNIYSMMGQQANPLTGNRTPLQGEGGGEAGLQGPMSPEIQQALQQQQMQQQQQYPQQQQEQTPQQRKQAAKRTTKQFLRALSRKRGRAGASDSPLGGRVDTGTSGAALSRKIKSAKASGERTPANLRKLLLKRGHEPAEVSLMMSPRKPVSKLTNDEKDFLLFKAGGNPDKAMALAMKYGIKK